MMLRTSIVVSGRVQGVAYRNSTQLLAVRLGVNGWVRNLPGGDVEACFEGDEHSVREIVDWCRRGPTSARVDKFIEHQESYTGEFSTFDIRY